MKFIQKISFSIFLILFFVSQSFGQGADDFREAYLYEYKQATDWVKQNKALIIKELGKEKAAFILSIAFPEIVRYKELNDFLETKSMELLYVRAGSTKIDFSVGLFQMKVSFVEQLEEKISKADLDSADYNYLSLRHLSLNEARKMRLSRLHNAIEQLRYLRIFYAWISKKLSNKLNTLSSPERLKIIATAYNAGGQHSFETLEKKLKQKKFPYGMGYHGTQYSYGEISADFYQRYADKLLTF